MRTLTRWVSFASLAIVTLVIAHDLVFVAGYGPQAAAALARTGHGDGWSSAVLVAVAWAACLAGLAVWRLHQLGLVARSFEVTGGPLVPGPARFVRGLVSLWVRLALTTGVLFVIQENLEHQAIGQALPGLSVLSSPQYPDAWLVILATALAFALVVALFRWHRDALIARIAVARASWPRTIRMARRRLDVVERRHASIVVHQFPGRAPPSAIPA